MFEVTDDLGCSYYYEPHISCIGPPPVQCPIDNPINTPIAAITNSQCVVGGMSIPGSITIELNSPPVYTSYNPLTWTVEYFSNSGVSVAIDSNIYTVAPQVAATTQNFNNGNYYYTITFTNTDGTTCSYDMYFTIACVYPESWDCDGQGNCSDPGTGTGTYASLSACNTACTPVLSSSWDCDGSGYCNDPGTGLGTFSTMMDCVNNSFCYGYNIPWNGCNDQFNPGFGPGEYNFVGPNGMICDTDPDCTPGSCTVYSDFWVGCGNSNANAAPFIGPNGLTCLADAFCYPICGPTGWQTQLYPSGSIPGLIYTTWGQASNCPCDSNQVGCDASFDGTQYQTTPFTQLC